MQELVLFYRLRLRMDSHRSLMCGLYLPYREPSPSPEQPFTTRVLIPLGNKVTGGAVVAWSGPPLL